MTKPDAGEDVMPLTPAVLERVFECMQQWRVFRHAFDAMSDDDMDEMRADIAAAVQEARDANG